MIILPAIDIKDGNCVRLFKGDYATVEKVAESPYIAAQRFADAGATWMHMVDLDGAKDAKLVNADLIADVAKSSGLSVEVRMHTAGKGFPTDVKKLLSSGKVPLSEITAKAFICK